MSQSRVFLLAAWLRARVPEPTPGQIEAECDLMMRAFGISVRDLPEPDLSDDVRYPGPLASLQGRRPDQPIRDGSASEWMVRGRFTFAHGVAELLPEDT